MKVIQFNWSPSVDGFFLEAAPTNEYLATPGLLDRFKFFLGYNSGEVAMGAAFARTKRAFIISIHHKFPSRKVTNSLNFQIKRLLGIPSRIFRSEGC